MAKNKCLAILLGLALMAGACANSGNDRADDATPSTTNDAEPSLGDNAPDTKTAELSSSLAFTAPEADPTPLPIDPDVRIGTLENGLTYYLRSNQAPGSRLELRLVVDAGSAMQDRPDAGLAHFVEHMLFNGTEKYPDNSLDDALQRLGLQFGADLNAYTSVDETVFILSSTTEPDAVTEAFDVLHEWATAATLDDVAVIEERGIVREERRVRSESGEGLSREVFDAIYDAGSEYEGYGTIGSADGILSTTAADARRFYDRWYRPDLMAIVAVGDLTLDQLEAEVKGRFADVADRGDGRPRTQPEAIPIDHQVVDLYLHPEVTAPRISLDYWVPSWDTGTVGGERLGMMDAVLAQIISARLDEGVELGQVRAREPFVGMFAHNRATQFLGFNFGGEDLVAATEDVLATIAAVESDGVNEAELARAVELFQTWITQYAATSDTRQDAEFAGEYVSHFLSNSGASAIDDWEERLSGILSEMTPDGLTNHFRYIQSVSAPLLVGMGPDAESVPTTEELESALRSGLRATASAVIDVEEIDELMVIPVVGDQGEEVQTEELGATVWRFENGTTGVFLHSDVAEGSVSLSARSAGGWMALDVKDRAVSDLATEIVRNSGLNGLDKIQIDRYLADQVAWVRPFVAEAEEGFIGGAATGDEETMFQLLHLSITEPQVSDVAFRTALESARIDAEQIDVSPQLQSYVAMQLARVGDQSAVARPPTIDEIDSLSQSGALDIYSQRIGHVDDLVVVLVGDIELASARQLMTTYIATLPNATTEIAASGVVAPPDSIVDLDVIAGSDRAGAGVDILFSSPQPITDNLQVHTEVLQIIVQNRLLEKVREELGATYSPSVLVDASAYRESIETLIRIDGDPDRLEEIEAAILETVRDLAVNGPTQDEFERAISVLETDYALVSNGLYIEMLLAVATDAQPDAFTRWDGHLTLTAMTRSDAAVLSAAMFPDDRWIRVARSQ